MRQEHSSSLGVDRLPIFLTGPMNPHSDRTPTPFIVDQLVRKTFFANEFGKAFFHVKFRLYSQWLPASICPDPGPTSPTVLKKFSLPSLFPSANFPTRCPTKPTLGSLNYIR